MARYYTIDLTLRRPAMERLHACAIASGLTLQAYCVRSLMHFLLVHGRVVHPPVFQTRRADANRVIMCKRAIGVPHSWRPSIDFVGHLKDMNARRILRLAVLTQVERDCARGIASPPNADPYTL